MELDQDDSEIGSGENETGEDDDDEESGSDNTNKEGDDNDGKEGQGNYFKTSILMVVVVLLFVVCWMLNMGMLDMKSRCPDMDSSSTRYYVWYIQIYYLGQPNDVFGIPGLSIWIRETVYIDLSK